MNFFLSSRWSVRLALIIIALLALIALTSQWWLPYDPQAIDLPSRLLSPDAQHWLGTDHLGRDIFLAADGGDPRVTRFGNGLPAAGADIRAGYWRQRRTDWRAR
ncbi:nickel ABC transporter, permease protein [Escherichia coli]|uniref:Nickel ABC transporter, permease protein n=1 Tax=Escherichia coli TaxID=562 RepID=A0A485J849_ECOLX|nr:nickel ABC transporter, permease protein [Escherichia coli]